MRQMASSRDFSHLTVFLFDVIWHIEEMTEDWKNQPLIPLHKKDSRTSMITIVALPSSVSLARSLLKPFSIVSTPGLNSSYSRVSAAFAVEVVVLATVFSLHTDGEVEGIPSSLVCLFHRPKENVRFRQP